MQSVCVRGMKNTTQEEFIIYTDEDLGKQIRCDAHTDGGGWIVFQVSKIIYNLKKSEMVRGTFKTSVSQFNEMFL